VDAFATVMLVKGPGGLEGKTPGPSFIFAETIDIKYQIDGPGTSSVTTGRGVAGGAHLSWLCIFQHYHRQYFE
jgi:hypothetical protein